MEIHTAEPKRGDYPSLEKAMKVRIFRQRVTQVHESETEINEWLEEMGDSIKVEYVTQSAYLTDNSETGTAGFIISVWYTAP